MATTNTRRMHATPQQVWDVLADGWLYPVWVVGASRMREVDDGWPEVGTRLHHSVGVWPLLIDDNTEVVECEPLSTLVLHARAWPTGKAEVRLQLEAVDGETDVTMSEGPIAGPATLVPGPVLNPLLKWRNDECLRRLAYLAERRSAGRTSDS